MDEISIVKADVTTIANWIADHSECICSDTRSEEESLLPAIKVIRCVLSLRTNYDKVVVPRVETFKETHSDIKQVTDLSNLIASFPTAYEFIQHELNFNSERKANIIQSVVKYLCDIVEKEPTITEEEAIKEWAVRANPQDCYSWCIKYFKVAGFQYLRMLFGADTTKPDKRIRDFTFDILNRNVSDIDIVYLMETASESIGFSVRDVDAYIWEISARPQQNNFDKNLVRLDPDVAAAFPNEEAVNEALRSYLKERNKEK